MELKIRIRFDGETPYLDIQGLPFSELEENYLLSRAITKTESERSFGVLTLNEKVSFISNDCNKEFTIPEIKDIASANDWLKTVKEIRDWAIEQKGSPENTEQSTDWFEL